LQRLGHRRLLGRQRAEQAHRLGLRHTVFGMLEGQAGKPALQRRQPAVVAAGDQGPCGGQRLRVTRKRARRVAERRCAETGSGAYPRGGWHRGGRA
jgi:hypothetical protein